MSDNNRDRITIHLDISIPFEGRAGDTPQVAVNRGGDARGREGEIPRIVTREGDAEREGRRRWEVDERTKRTSIQHPAEGGITYAKQVDGKWVICTNGVNSADVVFVEAYDGHLTAAPTGQPSGNEWHAIPDSTTAIWQIDEMEIPGPVNMGGSNKTLVFWPFTSGSYGSPVVRKFTAHPASDTYCGLYSLARHTMPQLGEQQRAIYTQMAGNWEFSVDGCTNQLCDNCDCLNGTWIVTCTDRTANEPYWSLPMRTSFADRNHVSYWRMSFNHNDGFWYLEVVGNLVQQMHGTWIAYRCHEREWNPFGSNTMHLLTDHEYCNVPNTLTIKPLSR